jgi:hypothetical protein
MYKSLRFRSNRSSWRRTRNMRRHRRLIDRHRGIPRSRDASVGYANKPEKAEPFAEAGADAITTSMANIATTLLGHISR